MRQIIFSNGDIENVSERSNHLNVEFENVSQERLLELMAMDQSIWESFTIRRITERDTKDFQYENHVLDHMEFRGNDVAFVLRVRTDGEIYKEALEILLGGES